LLWLDFRPFLVMIPFFECAKASPKAKPQPRSQLCWVCLLGIVSGSSLVFVEPAWRVARDESVPRAVATKSTGTSWEAPAASMSALAVAAVLAARGLHRPVNARRKWISSSIIACRGTVMDKVDKVKGEDKDSSKAVESAEAAEEGNAKPHKAEKSTQDSQIEKAAEAKDEQKKEESSGFDMFFRFSGALWETFLDVATMRGPKDNKKGWEYRKGIEGMSMGSMAYEMLTVSDDTEDAKALEKEYERGYGVPFLNLSLRRVTEGARDVTKSLGLDGAMLTAVNLLQTVGVPSDVIDGIPVQNKWISIVKENLDKFGEQEPSQGQRQVGDLVQNMVLGRMERITGAPMPVFLEGYGEREGIYKIVIGPRSVVVVSDPVITKRIFMSSQENYTKGILSEVLEPIMGKGLIPADPVTWAKRRRAIVPGLHKKFLQDMTSVMVDCAAALADDLERSISASTKSAEVNMEEKFTSASLDIIGKAIFDYDFGSVERESPLIQAVYNLLREAERRAQSVIPYWNLPGAPSLFRDQKDHSENLMLINAVLDELIKGAMQDDQQQEGKKTSLLQYLVLTKGEDVTTRQLRDDLMTLLIAGHETTAAMLTWTLHELMKPENKAFLEEVQQEVDTVLQGRSPTFNDFANLPSLRLCLLEALRLYPEPPLLIRRCVEGDEVTVGPLCNDVKTETVTFLPGQDIFISMWSLQRSEDLWGKDANKFNPHRFKEKIPGKGAWAGYDPEKAATYPNERASDFAFLPFGAGPRKCVGDNFALLEAEALMVCLLQRFQFEKSEDAGDVEMTTGATIHTAGGLMTKISKRTDDFTKELSSAGKGWKAPAPSNKPTMEKKLIQSVAQRITPEALTVPTPRELRMLFSAQKEDVRNLSIKADLFDSLESAFKKCQDVTKEHSKTFYLGSQLLEPNEQRVVWAIYNWCRSTDELVDGPEAANTTMEDLEEWERKTLSIFNLKDSLKGSNDWEDLALAESIRKFSLIQRPFQDMIGGMAMDLVKERYATFQELEVYCYRVAGTVGVMTLPVLGFDSLQNFTEELQEETISAAMSLGVAFQLTNILRDIGEDARRGRIYVPLEDLHRFNITEDEVLKASTTVGMLHTEQKWRDFMEFQMDRCEREYVKAQEGIVGLSEVNRLGVMAALFVYGDILDRVRENNYDNLSRRAYVPFADKMLLMGKAWMKCQHLKEVAEERVKSGKIFARKQKH